MQCPSDPSLCADCVTDSLHGLNGSVCSNCHPSCLTCSHSDYAQCTSCPNATFLSQQNECLPCLMYCLLCQSNNTCDTCANGFYLSNDGICYSCPKLFVNSTRLYCNHIAHNVRTNTFLSTRMSNPKNANRFVVTIMHRFWSVTTKLGLPMTAVMTLAN